MRSVKVTVSSRVLGRRLRAMREQAGLSASYVADVMGYSPAKLSRQEHGTHSIAVHELSHLVIHMYGYGSKVLDEMEALRQRTALGRGWWREFEGDIPLHLEAFIELEDEASDIITFSGDVIPGLLQDPEYVRLQARKFGTRSPDEVEQTVWLRTQRQKRLGRGTYDAILTEGAIRRSIGDGHYGQLETILERSEIPGVSVRVLPCSYGVHGVAGSYVILTIPDGGLGPIMYLEYCGGSFIVEEELAVSRTMTRHQELDTMDPEDSRDFLKRLVARNRTGSIGVA
jgi:transcriptional regulator with XRE-family HTH domain